MATPASRPLRDGRYLAADLRGKWPGYNELIRARCQRALSLFEPVLSDPRQRVRQSLPGTPASRWVILVAGHDDPFGDGGRPH